MRKKQYILYTWMVVMVMITACSDFVEIDVPRTELSRSLVFSDDETAQSAMRAAYVQATSSDYFVSGWYVADVSYTCGKSADEMSNGFDSEEGQQLCDAELTANHSRVLGIWRAAYESIYRVNAILEGVDLSPAITTPVKKQLEGEAKFLRAFNYFYLVNLFGEVPLLTTTDYRVNAVASRTPAAEVYAQMVADLKDAQVLLPVGYELWSNERIRPNRSAATALLARVYLFREAWELAEIEATSVIDQAALYSLANISDVFLKNNTEAIWQLLPERPDVNSMHGVVATNFFYVVPLSPALVGAWETGDGRKAGWTGNMFGFDFAYKYKLGYGGVVREYTTVLRLAEQFLIRAEARARRNNTSGAQEDLNMIRNRAGLGDTPAATQADLLVAIKHEKRMEFFAEYGHRWMDLKRWGDTQAVLGSSKPNWQPTAELYPIPQQELNRNKNLSQNPGYASL